MSREGKMCSRRQLSLVLAIALLIGSVIGGTAAWLIVSTEPLVNTFSYGDIDIELDETKLDEDGETVDEDQDGEPDRTKEGNEYEIIPGESYLKDPEVTVLAGNESCWLFVKLEEEGGVKVQNPDGSETEYKFDDYLTYEVEEEWTQLLDEEGNEVEGVYFRQVEEDTDDTEITYAILKNNQIKVKDEVDKDMLNALDKNGEDVENATYPSLSLTAYAVQFSGFEAEISEGAEAPTKTQLNAAALKAWNVVDVSENEEQP